VHKLSADSVVIWLYPAKVLGQFRKGDKVPFVTIQSRIDGVRACHVLSTGPLLMAKSVNMARSGDGASERRCGSMPGKVLDRGLRPGTRSLWA
jgi:hypothetical protein